MNSCFFPVCLVELQVTRQTETCSRTLFPRKYRFLVRRVITYMKLVIRSSTISFGCDMLSPGVRLLLFGDIDPTVEALPNEHLFAHLSPTKECFGGQGRLGSSVLLHRSHGLRKKKKIWMRFIL